MGKSKTALMDELADAGMDTSEMDPDDYTAKKLADMLSFVRDEGEDDDEGDPDVHAMDVTPDEPDMAGDDEPTVVQAPREDELDLAELTAELDADTADRIAELFGDAWEGEEDREDMGDGDADEPYVELVANYVAGDLCEHNADGSVGPPLTGDALTAILKGQYREVVERARGLGRTVAAFPVLAHNWPQTGGRRQIIVQVHVKPTRTSRVAGRRTARGDRL